MTIIMSESRIYNGGSRSRHQRMAAMQLILHLQLGSEPSRSVCWRFDRLFTPFCVLPFLICLFVGFAQCASAEATTLEASSAVATKITAIMKKQEDGIKGINDEALKQLKKLLASNKKDKYTSILIAKSIVRIDGKDKDALDVLSGVPTWAGEMGKDSFGVWAKVTVNGQSQKMRWIQAGVFLMGSTSAEKELAIKTIATQARPMPDVVADETEHQVTISQGFWLGDSECTQAMWRAVMGANPSKFYDDPQRPVERVDWNDAHVFLGKINGLHQSSEFRLPSEAEWEYACRAGTTTAYSFGATCTAAEVNFKGGYPFGGAEKGPDRGMTVPVKSLPPNAWGLYEMHGNVSEWCADWYGAYGSGAVVDPIGPTQGTKRVHRGGTWRDLGIFSRAASRNSWESTLRDSYLGFRLAATGSKTGSDGTEKSAF